MITTETALPLRPQASPAARAFYIGEAVLMSGIVLLGFWPFYAGLLTGSTSLHPVMYVHAAVFTGWLILLTSQVVLVYRRKVSQHRRVGTFGAAYAMLVLLLGAVVMILAPVQHVIAGEWTLDAAAGFLVLPIGDLLLFGGFFGAGIAYRRRPAVHKRLMLLASVALVFPAAARAADPSIPLMLSLWLLPLIAAMAFDALTLRHIHRVYYIGLVVLLIAVSRIALMESELWLPVGRRVIQAFLPAA